MEQEATAKSFLERRLERARLVEAVVMEECEVLKEGYSMKVARRKCSIAELDKHVAALVDGPS